MEVFNGISVSDGIGIGRAFLIPAPRFREIARYLVSAEDLDAEWQRLANALDIVKKQINSKLVQADKQQRDILQTYIVMLDDAEFMKQLRETLYKDCLNIEFILNEKVLEMAAMLKAAQDEYLSERASDVCDVFGMVIDELLGNDAFDYEKIPDGAIIVAENIRTSDAVVLLQRKINAIVVSEGGNSSHLAILSRGAGMPAVFGIKNIAKHFTSGTEIIVDGTEGRVYVNPDEETLNRFKRIVKQHEEKLLNLAKLRTQPALSLDGVQFSLFANIGVPDDIHKAVEEGADGIGLFRTEFLFMEAVQSNNSVGFTGVHGVSEEVQLKAYRNVLETMGQKSVTIRTLDTGGDKIIKEAGIPANSEQNPLLGSRAIRFTLAYRSIFKRQLRALYRASVYGNLRILLPLVTHLSQIQDTVRLVQEVQKELQVEGLAFRKDVPLGIMVETAATAIAADVFAKYSDFFSIGTNDLTQYTLGVDRENLAVADLYDEKNVAVLRLIKNTVEMANNAGINLSVCGEMASNLECVPILAGLGVRTFSMSPRKIASVKEVLSSMTIAQMQEIAQEALSVE